MYRVRESWTDERLDDFAGHVDKRFDLVETDLRELRSDLKGESKALRNEMHAGFDAVQKEMNARFEGLQKDMNARFEGLQRVLVYAAIAMTTAILAGYAALAGLIAVLL